MTSTSDGSATSVSVADAVAELSEMVEVSRSSPTVSQRLLKTPLTIAFEFRCDDGSREPYVVRAGGGRWEVVPGTVPEGEADIVIDTSPETLHRLTNGALGGREAMVSGLLHIQKAPSMPKMLLMRALFNRHKKARARGEVVAEEPVTGGVPTVPGPRPPAPAAE